MENDSLHRSTTIHISEQFSVQLTANGHNPVVTRVELFEVSDAGWKSLGFRESYSIGLLMRALLPSS